MGIFFLHSEFWGMDLGTKQGLGSKDLSRDLQLNCVISFLFHLHLVLHACAARFDVTGTVALFGFTFLN
jgi:hypothetical protein